MVKTRSCVTSMGDKADVWLAVEESDALAASTASTVLLDEQAVLARPLVPRAAAAATPTVPRTKSRLVSVRFCITPLCHSRNGMSLSGQQRIQFILK